MNFMPFRHGDGKFSDIWPEAHVDLLRDKHAAGLSRSEITKTINVMFGTSYTRNAIISKCKRLGLSAKGRSQIGRPKKKHDTSSHSIFRHPVNVVQPIEIQPEIICNPVSLLDLEDHQCRWPVTPDDAPQIKFCGANKLDPFSYCSRHTRMAYLPSRDLALAGA